MGRIKTQMIKRLTQKMLSGYQPEFKMSFEENKPVVAKHLSQKNKKMRNVIAGYVTRLMKHQEKL